MRVIDSHTEGEPTRTIVAGGPDLGTGPMAERASRLAQEHSGLYSSVILEPRGHDAIVGAMLLEPSDPTCAAGVIYFNPEGNLGMCGHGTIGLVATLAHMGQIGPGKHRIETPVGVVTATLADDLHTVSIRNVESYRLHKDVQIEVPDFGAVTGDVAWGGNWFFLGKNVPIALKMENIGALSDLASKVRELLDVKGITGTDGAYIDHIEFFGAPDLSGANAKNFVLCPGVAYDRSPCGTGSSAKLACLAADGLLEPGQDWVQESIIGSTYTASYANAPSGRVIPSITGRAFVVAEAELIFDAADPYRNGIIHD